MIRSYPGITVDALPEGLSAFYCYYDPTERARSLATFYILSLLASARERQLQHVYLVTTRRDVDQWNTSGSFTRTKCSGRLGLTRSPEKHATTPVTPRSRSSLPEAGERSMCRER